MRGFPRSRWTVGNPHSPQADSAYDQFNRSAPTPPFDLKVSTKHSDAHVLKAMDASMASPAAARDPTASTVLVSKSLPSSSDGLTAGAIGQSATAATGIFASHSQHDDAASDSLTKPPSKASNVDLARKPEPGTTAPGVAGSPSGRDSNTPLTIATEAYVKTDNAIEEHGGDAQPAASASLATFPVDGNALQDMFASMRSTLDALSSTMDTLSKSSKSIVDAKSALEASTQVNITRQRVAEQQERQEKQMQSLRDSLNERLHERIQSQLSAKANALTRDAVRRRIADGVRDQLLVQIPNTLRTELAQCKHQIACVQVDLYNSEARRYNSLLAQGGADEPLRPLLRPPAAALSTINEYGELEPPELDSEPIASLSFPGTIRALRELGQKQLQALLGEYGLARPAALDGQTSAPEMALSVRGLPDHGQPVSDDLAQVMAFIGVNLAEPAL